MGVEMIAPHRNGRKKGKTRDGRKLRRYKRRWKVERFFAWLFNYRRCIVRQERKEQNFKAVMLLASMMIFLKSYFHL
jgi:transposase